MTSVRRTILTVGLLLFLPAFASAQESGSGEVVVDSGAILRERLSLVWTDLRPIEFTLPEDTITAWAAEVKRYRERSGELRRRCHEEIRSANRDTIVEKAGQCLRSDLLLEITHRRKQRDTLDDLSVTHLNGEELTRSVDAWIDAAGAVIDGIDTDVFASIDMLKDAKRNLHATYRVPMLLEFTRARASRARHVVESIAWIAGDVATLQENPVPFLEKIVPCVELAHTTLIGAMNGETIADAATSLRLGIAQGRDCKRILDNATPNP